MVGCCHSCLVVVAAGCSRFVACWLLAISSSSLLIGCRLLAFWLLVDETSSVAWSEACGIVMEHLWETTDLQAVAGWRGKALQSFSWKFWSFEGKQRYLYRDMG